MYKGRPEFGDIFIQKSNNKIVEFRFVTSKTFVVLSEHLEEKYTVNKDVDALKVFLRDYLYIGKIGY